ncbi:YL1 nuclear protein-domain-containing protein [Gautieria morchelliformis]|nr:YL1 nuclear protein-domain-containing protein [Gautieria morchelliformis]
MFESDFASTDEDVDEEAAGENELQEEEKRAKKVARQKALNISKTPVRKVTFHSVAPSREETGPSTSKAKLKPQRRVSLGQVVDAETGKVLEMNKRQSTREATRLNTRELLSRLKHAEGRRASLTKRPKEVERRKTQAELITAALDMEEDNIKSHRDYLVTEEERRKKARVVKPTTVGPKIRWRSRVEDVTVTVYEPAVPLSQSQRPSWSSPFAPTASSSAKSGTPYQTPYAAPSTGQPPSSTSSQTSQPHQASQYSFAYAASSTQTMPTSSTTSPKPATQGTPANSQSYANQYYQYSYYTPQTQSPQSQYQPYGSYYSYQQPAGQYTSPQQPRPHLQLHPQGQIARKATEKQAKNFVEILVNEERPQDKPTWRETMNALFGEHADWDNVRVYVGKNRPFARQIQTCPITGLQARYRDPRTGVPYANAGAFRILTRLLAQEYVWSPAGAPDGIGVFVGHEKQRGAAGVPDCWGEAMAGVEDNWQKRRVEGNKEKVKEDEKEKEVRVGERRSSRIASEGGEATEKSPAAMDVDKATEGEQSVMSS